MHKYLFCLALFISHIVNCQSPCLTRIKEEAKKIDTISYSTGTGFLINSQGYILTNRHVIERSKELYVTFYVNGKKNRLKAKIDGWSAYNDIAIIKVDINGIFPKKPNIYFSSKELKAGDEIFTLGYPSPDYLGNKIKITNGIINSTSGFQDDEKSYQISAPIQPGNSGSPLCDKYGNIKGIIVASFQKGQNVNYAIKGEIIKLLSKSGNINLPEITSNESINAKISSLQSTVCLIENVSEKVYYEELEFKANTFSQFEDYEGCENEKKIEEFLKKMDDKYSYNDDKLHQIFNNKVSYAFYCNLQSFYNYKGKGVPRYSALFDLGAYENVINDVESEWIINSKNIQKLDVAGLEVFFRFGIFGIYCDSYIELYKKWNQDELEKLDEKITFYHKLLLSQKDYNYLADVTFWNKIKVMQVLKKYSTNDICNFIKETEILINNKIIETFEMDDFLEFKTHYCK